jgi:hypothetical protein
MGDLGDEKGMHLLNAGRFGVMRGLNEDRLRVVAFTELILVLHGVPLLSFL